MTRYLAAAALALLILPVTALRAQQSDDEWLSNCREGWGDWAHAPAIARYARRE